MMTSTPPCRAMSADVARISASAPRSSTLREFEIMEGPILREQIADETAMSRRAFLQGTGLLLGFAVNGASTESVFAAPDSRVVENEVEGSFAPNGFIRINPTGAVTLIMPMAEMGQGSTRRCRCFWLKNWKLSLIRFRFSTRRQTMRFTPTRSCTFKPQV